MTGARLALHQLRYEQKSYWRNPASAVFTFVFPVMFLVIFASLNADARIGFLGGLPYNQYYVPAILAFGLISACFTNLAMTVSIRRDAGILKRLRGTPLPTSALLGGLVLNSLVISAVLAVLLICLGMAFYGLTMPGHWPALALAVLVSAASFCTLGVAMAGLVPNADAAPAVVNGVLFPVLFLSGVFFPVSPDSVLAGIGDVLPVRPAVQALFAAFDPRLPHGPAHGFAWTELAVVAAWGVAGAVLAVRRFRWTPARR